MNMEVSCSYIFGKPVLDESFFKLNFSCKNKQFEKILQYSSGLSLVFKTSSDFLNIKYVCHYNKHDFIASLKMTTEFSLLGLDYKNVWHLMNDVHQFDMNSKNESDKILDIKFNLNPIKFKKYQLCFPTLSKILDMKFELSDLPIFEYIPNTVIFIGSSIAQDNYCCAHMNLCCYLYRKYNINAATCGISGFNTLHDSSLIDYLISLDRKIILMDLFDVSLNDYLSIKDKNVKSLIINKENYEHFDEIKKNDQSIKTIDIPGDGMFDNLHLNDYGTVLYADTLKYFNYI